MDEVDKSASGESGGGEADTGAACARYLWRTEGAKAAAGLGFALPPLAWMALLRDEPEWLMDAAFLALPVLCVVSLVLLVRANHALAKEVGKDYAAAFRASPEGQGSAVLTWFWILLVVSLVVLAAGPPPDRGVDNLLGGISESR